MPLVPQNIQELQPYKPGKPIEDVKREFGLDKVIKLASNENPLGVSPQAMQAMISTLHGLNRYPDAASRDLRLKLAEMFNVKMENVITGSGSEGILSDIMRTFLFDDEEVITSEGTFTGFYIVAKSRGIKLITVPLKNYTFDLDAIADQINNKTKIIYLVNPNNPTGTWFPKSEFDNFIKKVPGNVLVIMDEAYYEFVRHKDDYPDSMFYRYDNVISLRTFSKAYGLAGIRIGYGFAHEELISNLIKVKVTFAPSAPAQAAGLAALNDTQFLDYYLELNRKGKYFFYRLFEELGIEYAKSDTNFVMTVWESEERAAFIAHELLKRGVIVRPLNAFRLPNCIRVTMGLPYENEVFAEKLKEVIKL